MKLQGWLQEVPHGKFYPNLEVKLLHESLSSVATEEETTAAGAKTKDSSPKKKKQAMAASKSEKSSQQVGNDKENIIDTSKTCTQNYVEIKPFDGIIMNDFVEKSSEIEDVMGINVGGPVWAIDWLPTTTITNYKTGEKMNKKTIDSIEWRFLAVSSHPPCEVVDGKMIKRSPPDHYYDAPKGGINLIQIWAIPSNSHTDKDKVPIKPRMVFGLDHTSGVAWDLKWCINATTILPTEYKDALGLLSACFGDGTVQFYAVPDVSKDFLKVALGPQLDTVKKLPALVKGKVVDVIQLCIRWSPFHPNLLLSGASDGSIILWDMESAFNFKGANKTKDIEPLRIFQDGK
jgi:WD40 repeat protein